MPRAAFDSSVVESRTLGLLITSLMIDPLIIIIIIIMRHGSQVGP